MARMNRIEKALKRGKAVQATTGDLLYILYPTGRAEFINIDSMYDDKFQTSIHNRSTKSGLLSALRGRGLRFKGTL